MGTVVWLGKSAKVAQVTEVQVTAYDAATDYTLTVNDKDITVPGTTDAAGTISALVTAWNASEEPEHQEITASIKSGATDTIELTADEEGTPFTVTSSVSGGVGTIGAASTTTANKSPNDWADPDNWSTGAVPVSTDDVILENADEDRSIFYGLAQSAVTLTSLTIKSSFTGFVGLPEINQTGSADYVEYRDTELAISATNIEIGAGDEAGSGRIKLNTGAGAVTMDVYRTGRPEDESFPALLWRGTHIANVININRGSMGIAYQGGDLATVATLRVGYVDSPGSDVDLIVGSDVTVTTLNMQGGLVNLNSSVVTVNKVGGELAIRGDSTVTTLIDDDGLTRYYSSGTCTTLRIGSNAEIDYSQDMRAKTVTNTVQMYEGGRLFDPYGVVTFSGGIKINRCRLNEVEIDVGNDRTITVS